MKLRFYRRWYDDSKKSSTLATAISLEPINEEWEKKWQAEWKKEMPDPALTSAMARENALARPYATYLASSLESDFPEYRPEFCVDVIEAIEKLERHEIDAYTWDGQGFQHSLTRDKVTFEHTIFGECPEWPIWSCPLSHYKAALLGWRRFIDLPKAIDTELIVELPDPA